MVAILQTVHVTTFETYCVKYCVLIVPNAGLFYYTLGNLPPKYRSRLQAIQLLQVVEVQHIQNYGMDAVIAPFIDDMKILEQVRCISKMYPFQHG